MQKQVAMAPVRSLEEALLLLGNSLQGSFTVQKALHGGVSWMGPSSCSDSCTSANAMPTNADLLHVIFPWGFTVRYIQKETRCVCNLCFRAWRLRSISIKNPCKIQADRGDPSEKSEESTFF